jgi:hypothetical protein
MNRWGMRVKPAVPLAALAAISLVLAPGAASAVVPRMLGVNPKQ